MSGTIRGTKLRLIVSIEGMRLEDLLRRLDELIDSGEKALQRVDPDAGTMAVVPADTYAQFKSASQSYLDRTFGPLNAYSNEFMLEVTTPAIYCVQRGLGVLKGARGELAGGWLRSTRGLLSAEVFADLLSMAEHLLDNGYKDPSAVMAGSTLEEHLRQLAGANDIPVEDLRDGKPVPRKADAINADLAKSVYDKLDQQNVTAWLALRNKAAHGKYSEYNSEQVRIMLSAVREFIGRVRVG